MTILTDIPVSFTKEALKEISGLNKALHITAEQGLRIGIKGGGCSGFTYLLAFDKPDEKDNIYILDDIKIIINKAHVMHILGMEIDFETDINNRGFSFNNPNSP
jgi:iron-sulfur cluster assembly protein